MAAITTKRKAQTSRNCRFTESNRAFFGTRNPGLQLPWTGIPKKGRLA